MRSCKVLFFIRLFALTCAVRADYQWISQSHGKVPSGAVFVGFGQANWLYPLYVGRAWYNGALLPCKLAPAMGFCYISWLGKEIRLTYYQVLCDDKIWVKTSGGTIPKGAIPGGRSETGETLYIRRAYHKGLTMGKVQPSKGCMFMPYDGKELTFTDFEILTINPNGRAADLQLRGRNNLWENRSTNPKPINETLEDPSNLVWQI